MPQLLVIRWRDIPAQVIAREARVTEKRELPVRFVDAIDRAAMRAGLKDSDGYLGEWQRGEDKGLLAEVQAMAGVNAGLAALANAALASLELAYDDERLKTLTLNDGFAVNIDPSHPQK